MANPTSPAGPPEQPGQPFDPELRAAGQLASPTWELELFLSGALVFTMFQLPGAVDDLFRGIEPHLAGTSRAVVNNLALYAKAIAYSLLLTFAIHLIGRAQWVGLMGLQSVFPGGIRWDTLKMGPMARELYRTRTPALSSGIARLDNFCSVIFSLGMLFVLLFIYSATIVGVMGGLGWGLARAFTGGRFVYFWFAVVISIFVAIPVISGLADKRVGATIQPGSAGHRVLAAMLRVSYVMNFNRVTGPMLWTLVSNVGRAKAMAALYVGLMAMLVLAAGDQLARRDSLSLNNYDYFGESATHSVVSGHYENQRPVATPPRTPMIQSDIVRDPYVKLFIPYSPHRHNASLARECPGLKPLQARGLQIGAETPVADSLAEPALRCLAKLHAVTLDGVRRPELHFAFHEHPGTGLRGILAYIPVDSLPRGRHVITVMPSPPPELPTDSAALANAAWKKPYVIPFWK